MNTAWKNDFRSIPDEIVDVEIVSEEEPKDEKRSDIGPVSLTSENSTPELLKIFAIQGGIPGITVTHETAVNHAIIYTCVKIIAETIGMLPCVLYKQDGRRKRHATDHPLYWVLKSAFNEELTAAEGFEMIGGHCSLRGNSFWQRMINGAGQTIGLWPLHPSRMSIKRTQTKRLIYSHRNDLGQETLFVPDQILHIKSLSDDGVWGMSPVALLKSTIECGLAQEKATSRLWANGVRTTGTLEHPGEMSDAAYERLKTSFYEQSTGIENTGRPILLEEGTKWQQIGMSFEDAQAIDFKKDNRQEIVAAFRVPQHMAGILDKATFSNIEHQAIEFVKNVVLPWLRKIWQRMELTLLTEAERKAGYFIRFNVNALLQGDVESRYKTYAIGRQNGWLSANEIRELEDMDPIPGEEGDKYQTQMNLAQGGGDSVDPKKEIGKGGKRDEPEDSEEARDRNVESNVVILNAAGFNLENTLRYVVEDQVERFLKREQKTLESRMKNAQRRSAEEFVAEVTNIYADLQSVLSEYIAPTVRSVSVSADCDPGLLQFACAGEAGRYAARSADDLKALLKIDDRAELVEKMKEFIESRTQDERAKALVDAMLAVLNNTMLQKKAG